VAPVDIPDDIYIVLVGAIQPVMCGVDCRVEREPQWHGTFDLIRLQIPERTELRI